ncbi:hypothetical protein ROZALSC1DRAFT_26016, partial [Rozella allomycis CSF55]
MVEKYAHIFTKICESYDQAEQILKMDFGSGVSMTKLRGAKMFYCKMCPDCERNHEKTALSHYYTCKCGKECPARYRLLFCDVCDNCAFWHNAQNHVPTENATSRTRLKVAATQLIEENFDRLPLEIAKIIEVNCQAASLSRQQISGVKNRLKISKGYTNKLRDIKNHILEIHKKSLENFDEISESEKNQPLLFGFDIEDGIPHIG